MGMSIIDKDLKVEGTVHAEGKLIIAGTLQGTLIGNTVIAAQGSRITAQAKVREMVVAGEFKGDITASESLQIVQTGNLGGNVICKSLTLEAGGKLNGNVKPISATDERPSTYQSVAMNERSHQGKGNP